MNETGFVNRLSVGLLLPLAFLCGAFTLLSPLRAAPPLAAGAEFLAKGFSSQARSLGGTAIGLQTGGAIALDYPAPLARLLRRNVSFSLSPLNVNLLLLQLGYNHPSQYGVFAFNYLQLITLNSALNPAYQQDTYFVGNFFSLSASFAKQVLQWLDLAAQLHLDYWSPPTELTADGRGVEKELPFGLTFDLALRFTPAVRYAAPQHPFVFERVSLGILLRNVGLLPLLRSLPDKNARYARRMEVPRLGAGFDYLSFPFKAFTWRARLLADLALLYPLAFKATAAVKQVFLLNTANHTALLFNLGYFYDPALTAFFPLTFGPGVSFEAGKNEMELTSSFTLETRQADLAITGVAVSLTFNFFFGLRDRSSPIIDTSVFGEEGVIK